MKKIISLIGLTAIIFALSASFALAAPLEKTEAFVCPVIKSEAMGTHNPNAVPLGDTGTYTVGPPTGASGGSITVPVHATNGNGAGVPGGPQSEPGDKDYTAIWAK